MDERDEHELTPEFRQALDALPREREPSAGLEDRTVEALARRGLIETRRLEHGRRAASMRRPAWLSWAGVAAALVIFAAGIGLGHRLGSTSAVVVLAPSPDGDPVQTAAYVQHTGSAHAAALRELAEAVRNGGPEDVALARDVSVAALRASLEALTRIDPSDPTPALLLAEIRTVQPGSAVRRPPGEPWVIWF
jgi:hypothetical protein